MRPLLTACVFLVAMSCGDIVRPGLVLKSEGAKLRFAPPAGFVEAQRFARVGTRRYGQCAIGSTDTLRKGEYFVEYLASLDTLTCQYIMVRGRWSGDKAQRPTSRKYRQVQRQISLTYPDSSVRSSDTKAPQKQWSWGDVGIATGNNCQWQAAWQRTYFEDPIQINVTQSQVDVEFCLSTECIESAVGVHHMQWFDDSGWELDGDGNGTSPGCESRPFWANAFFTNDNFCYPGVAYSNHWLNEVTPLNTGEVVFDHSGSASGSCASMLRYIREVGTPF